MVWWVLFKYSRFDDFPYYLFIFFTLFCFFFGGGESAWGGPFHQDVCITDLGAQNLNGIKFRGNFFFGFYRVLQGLTSPIMTANCGSQPISFKACAKKAGCGLPTTSALTSEANSRAVTKGPGPSASPSPLL